MPTPKKKRCKACRTGWQANGTDCHKCKQRKWRAKNRERAAFATLRDHARQREIPFALEFVQFLCFAKLSGYVEKKGNHKEGLTVDRKDNLKGYIPGNIQPMSRSRNSTKRNKEDMMRHTKGYGWNGGIAPGEPSDFSEQETQTNEPK